MSTSFDWQGHRGARGLLPENTIPSFLKALEYEAIRTLELDVVISADSQVVVSHEPWMSAEICSHPNGNPVLEAEEDSTNLFTMTYEEIKQYDCGSRGNSLFPDQQPMRVHKPLLSEVIDAVKDYVESNSKMLPYFNIEIKSDPEYDGTQAPEPMVFAQLVWEVIQEKGVGDQVCVQSFDVRSLQAFHQLAPNLTTALLVANARGVSQNIDDLGYTPEVYSPNFQLVNANLVKVVHEKGMKIIPWTVNEVSAMRAMINLGVDGIITDYPNRIELAV